jgi:hypothetical protein
MAQRAPQPAVCGNAKIDANEPVSTFGDAVGGPNLICIKPSKPKSRDKCRRGILDSPADLVVTLVESIGLTLDPRRAGTAQSISPAGTFETSQLTSGMSVNRGRPKVTGRWSNRRDCPLAELESVQALAAHENLRVMAYIYSANALFRQECPRQDVSRAPNPAARGG